MSIAALPKPDHGVTDVLRDVVDFDPDELVVIAMKGGKMYRCFNSDYNSVKVLGAIEILKAELLAKFVGN